MLVSVIKCDQQFTFIEMKITKFRNESFKVFI